MAERDDGILAPFDIKSKAEKYVKELRKKEDTNYDEADNKYDAIRHIGASLAMYAQYPDLASDIILGGKEYLGSIGDSRGKEMDLHNNAIGKAIYESLSEEEAESLTTEKALEIAKEYFEKAQSDESIPEEMRPKVIYGATKEPEKEDGGLYEIGPEGTWVEKSEMNNGGLMGSRELARQVDPETVERVFIYKDEQLPLDNPKLEEMNELLDSAFRGLFNAQRYGNQVSLSNGGDELREAYSDRVREIRDMDPELFDEYFLARNTEEKSDALNREAFSDNPASFMQEEADEVPYVLNIPFGSEDEYTLGGPTGLRGWARHEDTFGNREILVAGKGGSDEGAKRSGVIRHETRHLKTKDAPMPMPYKNEELMRSFDALSAVLSQDMKKVEDIFDIEYGARFEKTPELKKQFQDWFANTFMQRVQTAVAALPKMYETGVYDKEKVDTETLQKFLEDYDKDEQGFISYLLGEEPKHQNKVEKTINTSLDDVKEIAKMISAAPFAEDVETIGFGNTARVKYNIDRDSAEAEMNEGGLMADPLVLSETAEEEAEPKMGIGEYIQAGMDLVEDFSPAGTAQSMIDAAEEAYKLATGSEDASVMDFGIAAIGALPGGKTATKAVETAAKLTDDVVEASQNISKLDNYVPKSTVTAYKLVKEKNGKFYPLFVAQGKEKSDFPVGEWIKAEAGELSPKGKVKSSIGELAYRPGFHAGDLPIATHIGGKSSKAATKPDYRPDDQVWVEIEMANDVDWGSEALKRAQKTKDGRIKSVTAHITDMVPHGGHYRYKTNPNMTGEWLIGGEMKVTRVLSDDEVKKLNDAAGVADLPRKSELQKDTSGLMSDAYNRAEQ